MPHPEGTEDTSGVNFINISLKAFTCADPKSAKRQSSCQSFFVLSGSACKKAASWMLVKSPPDAAWQKCINWGELNIGTKNIRTKKNLCERERKVIFVSSLLTMMVSLFSGEIIPLEKWIHN